MRYRVCTLFVSFMLLSACGKKDPVQPNAGAAPPAAVAAPTPAPTPAAPKGEPAAALVVELPDDPPDEPKGEPAAAQVDPTDDPTDEPAGDPTDEPADDPTDEPAGDPTDEPSGDEPVAPAAPSAAPSAAMAGPVMDPSRCAALVARELALIRESGTDEMRSSAAAKTEAELVATCASAPVPASYEQCVSQVATAVDIYRTCVARIFEGRDLTVGRTFSALQDNSGAEPPVFDVDGDTMSFATCRMIHQKVGNFRGFFVDCPGKPTLGPLTTGDDIKASIAALMEESANAHATVIGIMNNYPRGGGPWRVCQNGHCRIE